MQKLILVSATAAEIEPTLNYLEGQNSFKWNTFLLEKVQITVCICGVGMYHTAFELGKFKGEHYDLAINAGLAGSFGLFAKGEVVNVISDCFSELGAEDGSDFLSMDDLGFGKQHTKIVKPADLRALRDLPESTGITVNTVNGTERSIEKVKKRYAAGVETMEGAAFTEATNTLGWKAIQLRAISNLVEKRNRSNWNIPLAVKNLNEVLITIINELNA